MQYSMWKKVIFDYSRGIIHALHSNTFRMSYQTLVLWEDVGILPCIHPSIDRYNDRKSMIWTRTPALIASPA